MTAPTFHYHADLNVLQISQDKEIVFVGADHALAAITALLQIRLHHSAPTSASLEHGAAGTPENRIGKSDQADATREGAELHYLDNRRHSVHADLYACDPDESGGLAS